MQFQQLSLDDAIALAQEEAKTAPEPPSSLKWSRLLFAVYVVMQDGRWRTLAEIAFAAKAPEASVSARIRDLANEKGIPHEKRKAPEGKLYVYRLLPPIMGT